MSNLIKNNQHYYECNENFSNNNPNEENEKEKVIKKFLERLKLFHEKVINELPEHRKIFNQLTVNYDNKIHLHLNILNNEQLKILEELFNDGLKNINLLIETINIFRSDLRQIENFFISEIESYKTSTDILTGIGLVLGVIPGILFAYVGNKEQSKYKSILNIIQNDIDCLNEFLKEEIKLKKSLENRKIEYINFINNKNYHYSVNSSENMIIIGSNHLYLNSKEESIKSNNNKLQIENFEYNCCPDKKLISNESKSTEEILNISEYINSLSKIQANVTNTSNIVNYIFDNKRVQQNKKYTSISELNELNNHQYINKQGQPISYICNNSFSKEINQLDENIPNQSQNRIYQFNKKQVNIGNNYNDNSFEINRIYQFNQNPLNKDNTNNHNSLEKKAMGNNFYKNLYYDYENKSNSNFNMPNDINILPTLYAPERINPIIVDSNPGYLPLMNTPIQKNYYTREPKINPEEIYSIDGNIDDSENYYKNYNAYNNNY